jgi:hypothetical protein
LLLFFLGFEWARGQVVKANDPALTGSSGSSASLQGSRGEDATLQGSRGEGGALA